MSSDHCIEDVAACVMSADFVLIAAGAGFSADSGLLTYEDCRAAGLDYDHLCHAELLYEDPSLAFGFWASSLQRYRDTPSHDGYAALARLLQSRTKAGRAYVYTSNVDGHFRRLAPLPLFEIHGCLEEWMCSSQLAHAAPELMPGGRSPAHNVLEASVPIEGKRWEQVRLEQRRLLEAAGNGCGCAAPHSVVAPADWLPAVDAETLRLHEGAVSRAGAGDVGWSVDWSSGVPKCPCGLPMRPRVLMFGDEDAALQRSLKQGAEAYQRWEDGMEAELASSGGKLVILELGCGTRVQSIRQECEMVFRDAAAKGACVTLVRINPSEDSSLDGLLPSEADGDDNDGREDPARRKFVRLHLGAQDALCRIEHAISRRTAGE